MYTFPIMGLVLLSILSFADQQSDSQNLNRALSEKNTKYCSLIQEKDQSAHCFGIIKHNAGYCKMIANTDLQNQCLAVALNDSSYCKKISHATKQKECTTFLTELKSYEP